MKYRRFGKLDWRSSVLGFGVRRLPRETPQRLDQRQISGMLHLALESGLNYIDLGFTPDPRYQENMLNAIKVALNNGYRQKAKLAASIPVRRIRTAVDLDRYLEQYLGHLGAINFCILSGLDRWTWPGLEKLEVADWIERNLKAGKFEFVGFSFHDQFQYLREIVEAYSGWSLAGFQYSFMDIDHHPGTSGLQFASRNGLAVVTSEPLKSGRLAANLPGLVSDFWSALPGRSPAEWGLRWVMNHAEISTVVVDMSSLDQVQQNLALAADMEPDSLGIEEEVTISRIRDAYRKSRHFPCTACRSCMPCPQGIDAPRIFELYNDAVMYRDKDVAREIYLEENHDPGSCTECGRCVKTCGKQIDIPSWLKAARSLFEE